MKRVVGAALLAALAGCAQPGAQEGSYDPGRAMMLLQASQAMQPRLPMATFYPIQTQQSPSFNCSPNMLGGFHCQ